MSNFFYNEEYYLDKAPPTPKLIENNNIYYNCTECASLIEILSINEDRNIIEFQCLNKDNIHEKKTMTIKNYIEKMQKYNNKKINDDICEIHRNKYTCYCFNCKCHLCQNCLKKRTHIFHKKNYIEEIKPIDEELDIILVMIEDYQKRIEQLSLEKFNKINELNDLLQNNKRKENIKRDMKIKKIDNNLKNELNLNNNEFLNNIIEIKKKYEEEIKNIKSKYKIKNNKIKNKYKVIKKKEHIIYNFQIDKLNKNHDEEIRKLEYDSKIEKMENIKKLNEIIYNTYFSYQNNYYNNINLNTLLLSYFENEYI